MQGAIIACSVHLAVYNASTRRWQEVSEETFRELMEMAQEVGDVIIYEGACDQCLGMASDSFHTLYASRYADAMQRELSYDICPPYDASEE